MDFAGMKLKITDAARSEIQQQVDALRASDKYFRLRLDLVLLYFPIIERVMKEENLPDDIKYLVIQESGLVSDAVSSANAVGFWMFKEPAGREVGLRIDKYVDERLNIVSSTRGACKYIKRHNFFFNNWVYSVIAHNTGRAGAEKHVDKSNFGANRMTIDKDTHWYFKTFLAHKVAFEGELKGKPSTGLELLEYTKGADKTLDKIARDLKADEAMVYQYNKWLKRGPVPGEKEYTVIIPVQKGDNVKLIARENAGGGESQSAGRSLGEAQPDDSGPEMIEEKYPLIKPEVDTRISSFVIEVNGIPAIIATAKDDLKSLAGKSGVDVDKLVKFNDLKPNQKVQAGQVFYLKRKKWRSKIYYHTVKPGETLWEVAQDYGIGLSQLARKNRMMTIDPLEEGRVLWLRNRRPASEPIEIKGREPVAPLQLIADEHQEEDGDADGQYLGEELENPPSTTRKSTTDNKLVEATENQPIDRRMAAETKMLPQPPQERKTESKQLAPAEVAANPNDVHVVSKGETLYGIARRYGVTTTELQEWNGLEGSSALSIGQELRLVKRDTANTREVVNPSINNSPQVTVHVVERGDTMYSISRKYNIPIEKLMKLNDKTNFVLSVGEKLKITD